MIQYIVPLQFMTFSEYEVEVMNAVGEKANVKQIARQLKLSYSAAWQRVKRLIEKGALTTVTA